MNKGSCIFGLVLCHLTAGQTVCATESSPTLIPLSNHFQLRMSEPVVVALAPPGEKRWGQYQFVGLSAYPGGKLLLRFHAGEDSVRAYGSGQPTFLSSDQGCTWSAFQDPELPGSGLVSEVFDGQFLCMPMPKPVDVPALHIDLPPPFGEFFCYRTMLLYRAEESPARVRDFLHRHACRRWSEREAKWLPDATALDLQGRLVWIAQGSEAGLVTGTSFERPPIRVGTELLWADYRATYTMPDGSAPKGCGVSCMVSTNNGNSWRRQAAIANANTMPGEISNMTEPVLSQNVGGEVVCVLRRTDQRQKSMLITLKAPLGSSAANTWQRCGLARMSPNICLGSPPSAIRSIPPGWLPPPC